MTSDMTVQLLWLAGGLAVVISALAARRLPMARAARLALVWLALFAGLTMLLTVTGVNWDG